ncbi:MAG TPA: asparagine synthase (glutamine-hydrolyzing) [Vicinamibacteria bacterium]
MCGIAGVLSFERAPVEAGVLRAMADALRHRGPDAEGFFSDCAGAPSVGLAHRRLSIIDLSHAADHPVPNEDGSVQVMLNGEVYNFGDLRRELAARHVFRSQGDTEVIAHGYEERGEAMVEALDGMFALAIWDGRRRRLVLARDAFGKKPLYYWHDGRRLVFGSEVKALLAAGVPAEMDEASLPEYLALGYVPTPRSLFGGVRKLPPASILVADARGVQPPRRYWEPAFPARGAERAVGLSEAAADVRELLTAAVRKRLVADVPLGVLLSGGVDSSAIGALTARLVPGRVKTFTAGFEGDAFFDERAPARAVAAHIGSEHHDSVVRPQAAALIETLLHHHDEPFGDSSALPTYLVAQAARRHVTVALNGDGGDETFAGYAKFHAALLAERIPDPLRGLAAIAGRWIPPGAQAHGMRSRARRFLSKAALPPAERLLAWASIFDVPALRAALGHGIFDRARLLSSYEEALQAAAHGSTLSRALHLNARTYLLDDLLPKMDRMTMAHGLEARSPLLDRALFDYVASLPDALKRSGARGKIVLKHAVADLLPPAILSRPKHGFGVPLGAWFRGDLRPLVHDTLLSSPRLARFLRLDAVQALFAEHLSGRADRGHQLWTLLTLELWLRKHRFE